MKLELRAIAVALKNPLPQYLEIILTAEMNTIQVHQQWDHQTQM